MNKQKNALIRDMLGIELERRKKKGLRNDQIINTLAQMLKIHILFITAVEKRTAIQFYYTLLQTTSLLRLATEAVLPGPKSSRHQCPEQRAADTQREMSLDLCKTRDTDTTAQISNLSNLALLSQHESKAKVL